MNDQRSTGRVVAIGAAIALLIVLLLVLAIFAFGDDETSETTLAAETTTTQATTTTASTTSTTEGTSTTEAVATTTTTSATTTTTSATTTTTTIPPLVLEPDGIGGVDFGAAPDVAIAYATAFLGAPDRDTGWVDFFSEFGTCPPPEVRGVQWGTGPTGFSKAFTLLFTKAATSHLPAGGEHLFGYDYFGGDIDLSTPEGLSVGSTLTDARALYPTIEIDESPWDPANGVWVVDDDPSDDSQLSGFATGRADPDLVTSILGGITCGE